MKIPLVDLKAQYALVGGDIRRAVEGVLESAQFLGGEEATAFEREFAAFVGAKHCAIVSNGTSALYLALAAAGVGPGDEVITTPMTFIATAEAIRLTGAVPVFADVNPDDLLLDPERVERAVTPRTRAIVPVHLYGQPVDMDPLRKIAAARSLLLIEDAAQAHGAEYRGRRAGSLCLAAAFSFYPGKNLGAAGDGGAVTTDDAALAERVVMLRDHGRRPSAKYEHELEGFNFRLSTIQAAILRVKLRHLGDWVARRAEVARQYDAALAGTRATRIVQRGERTSAHHLYVVRVPDRDRVLESLKAAGIGAGIHYPIPVHLQPAYSSLGLPRGSFPNSERAAAEILSLPLYPEMTEEHVRAVVAALRSALEA